MDKHETAERDEWLEALVREEGACLYGVLLRVLGEAAAARAVLEQTLVEAAGEADGADTPAALRIWIYRRALSHAGAFDGPPEASGRPRINLPGVRQRLGAAIDRLPLWERLPLLLRDVCRFPTREVAAILQLGEEEVRQRVHRTRLTLRAAIYGPTPAA